MTESTNGTKAGPDDSGPSDESAWYYKYYCDYRSRLEVLAEEQTRSLDTHVLTLSSWAIGLSLVLLGQFRGPSPLASPYWLYICWIALVACIALKLFSFAVAVSAMRTQIENWDGQYSEGNMGVATMPTNRLSSLVEVLNWIASACFVIGVGALCVFAVFNVQ